MKSLPALESFLEGLAEPHILLDKQYRILSANTAYLELFGEGKGVVGRNCYEVSHHFKVPCDQAGESCSLAKAKESGKSERVMHLHHTKTGEEYVNIDLMPIFDEDGEQAYFVEKMDRLLVAKAKVGVQGLIGRSKRFREMLALIARVAPSMATVLLLGESGTGKELVAQATHAGSSRAERAMVVVDCASMPENLFESELFGHERGAFTGANSAHAGLVEAASGGTLFLDEVGDIPLTIQVKLLRLLETGTFRRVGSTELRHADIRVISATHRDLESMVSRGDFREDLYYRLSTFPIHLPALRERREDIPLLSASLLARLDSKRDLTLSSEAQRLLQDQRFPGNVRELRNVLERAALLCDGDSLEISHIRQSLGVPLVRSPSNLSDSTARIEVLNAMDKPGPSALKLKDAEREAFKALVSQHSGSRAALARKLGISTRSLYRKLNALN